MSTILMPITTILESESERVLIAVKVCIDKEFALAGRCIHETYGNLKNVNMRSNYTKGT